MKPFKRTLITFALIVVFHGGSPLMTLSQDSEIEWTKLMERASALIREGDFSEAEQVMTQALDIAEKNPGTNQTNLVRSLNALALVFYRQGKLPEATTYLQRELKIKEEILYEYEKTADRSVPIGEDIVNLGLSIIDLRNKISASLIEQNRLDEAKTVIDETHRLPVEHPYTVTTDYNHGFVLMKQGKEAEALPLLTTAAEIRAKHLGDDHPDTAESLHALAVCNYELGDYDAAGPLYQRALEARVKLFGPNDPRVVEVLENFGVLYVDSGRPELGEMKLRQAILITERNVGKEDPAVAKLLDRLAFSLKAQRKYSDAQSLLERALAIYEKAFGSDDSRLIQPLEGLAVLAQIMNKPEEVERYRNRIVEIQESKSGQPQKESAP